MDEQSTPASPHPIEMMAMPRYARANDAHIVPPLSGQPLAGTERNAVLPVEQDLLLQTEIDKLLVGGELVA
jgi:hypothetical protein